jgi:mono/diheme cytochrome c family protein
VQAVLVMLVTLFPAGTAAADHLVVDVVGPDSAALGDELEIRTSVRYFESGEPAPDVEVVFYSDASFVGVSGEIELGRVTTDEAGVAIFLLRPVVSGTHAIRIEAIAGPEVQPESVSIPVTVGGQLVRSEAGVDIPGFGGWIVTAIIGLVWAIMLVAVLRIIGVARAGPSRRRLSLAEGIGAVSLLLATGLTVLLIRSPDTHANLNPEGYLRTVVAYTEADYLYPGPGLASQASAEQTVAYGRAIFMSRGCAGCHGLDASGAATAPSPAHVSREWLGQVVRTGLPGGMPAYTEVDLNEEDLSAIFVFLFAARATIDIEDIRPALTTSTTTTAAPGEFGDAAPTFTEVVAPILQTHCEACHGSLGGWDASSFDAVMTTGDHGPVVIAGDPAASLLVQKIQGAQTEGLQMPPPGLMSERDIQAIVDWITAGAPR